MAFLRRALPLAFALVLTAPFGHAVGVASCVQEAVADQAARAEGIAMGTVTQTRQTFVAASGVIGFRPERVLKGTLSHDIQVYLGPTHGGAVTGVDYTAAVKGGRHTLYLRAVDDGSYETSACSGSHTGALTIDEERVLGTGTNVSVTPADTMSPANL